MIRRPALLLAGASTCVLAALTAAQDATGKPEPLHTRWTATARAGGTPEYPRPQLVRRGWRSLNGWWQFAITAKDAERPASYQGKILVPFPLESMLSGVHTQLHPDQILWYRRTIAHAATVGSSHTLLHFGAVDYQATVFLNGREVGGHTGGYQSFTVDLTPALKTGSNELVVKVEDPTDEGPNPHGKQTLHPEGILYTSTSGIWQTVWLETVPETWVESLTITPDVDRSALNLEAHLRGPSAGYTVEAIVRADSTIVARQIVTGATAIHIDQPHLWSPDDPFLYALEVRVLHGPRVVDDVRSYFGLRKIEVRKDSAGVDRIFLNGRYTYNLGVLDQGFWPDGLYAAPTDSALAFDIKAIKAMGFNTIRKHVKIEPDRWYYYCDRLGMLVWQDMVPPANGTAEAKTEFERETEQNLTQLHNHPSIVTWVLFNEGWGAYDQERLDHWVKQLDPSRLLDPQSGSYRDEPLKEAARHVDPTKLALMLAGDRAVEEEVQPEDRSPENWVGGDLTDFHHYPNPVAPPAVAGKARVVGEHGGIGVFIEGHVFNDLAAGWGYVQVSPGDMVATYRGLVTQLKELEAQGVSGSIYTQPTDIETEQNGLMTYDREITKMPISVLASMNSELVQRAKNYVAATRGVTIKDADVTPAAQRYAALLAAYHDGSSDRSMLRRLTLMALRQKDQPHATRFGNLYIDGAKKPYSADTWAFIQTVTRTSQDRGFELLRTHAGDADAILGPDSAEVKVREIIAREEVKPYLADSSKSVDWDALEARVRAKYGALGAEEVYGAAMFAYLVKHDWPAFGKYYARYYRTAALRSEYPINPLSYQLFEHVADTDVLAVAIAAEHASIGKTTLAESDATELDTYANLLYKAGHTNEAIEWEEKAARYTTSPDSEITDNLATMKAGHPTWHTD